MNENSGPHDTPGVKRPPRAEPLQPDKPGGGDLPDAPAAEGTPTGGGESGRQSNDALDNVREGYD